MPEALWSYNIICWNSSPIEKRCGNMRFCNTVVGQPKPAMLKTQAQTIFLIYKILKNANTKNEPCQHKREIDQARNENCNGGIRRRWWNDFHNRNEVE